jgi:hypothetical protein
MSIFTLNEFKKRLNSADVIYKGVDLHVKYKIENDSFDHEFGTEKKPDHIEIYSVTCDMTDITEMLVESQIEDIETLVKESI